MENEFTTPTLTDEHAVTDASTWQKSDQKVFSVGYAQSQFVHHRTLSFRQPLRNALTLRAQKKAHRQYRDTPSPRRTLILGSGEAACVLAEELQKHFPQHYSVLGFVEQNDTDSMADNGREILGTPSELRDLVRRHGVDNVMFSNCLDRMLEEMAYQVRSGKDRRQSAGDKDKVARAAQDRRRHIDARTQQAASSIGNSNSASKVLWKLRINNAIKRGVDVSFSLAALMIALPLAVPVAVAIKLSSPGPVFYSQQRVGRNGRLFTIYKLRTMTVDAETSTGPILERKGDSRSTRIGRLLRLTKLDEWPQFYNVLRGDMSIVGPRPERPHFAIPYKRYISDYERRHEVRPGLTGLAQVKGGYLTHVYVKLHYDLDYVDQQSCWLDCWIMLQTPLTVLQIINDTARNRIDRP